MTREQINKKRNEWHGRAKGPASYPRKLNNLRQRVEYLEEMLLVLSQPLPQPLPWYVRLWRSLSRLRDQALEKNR